MLNKKKEHPKEKSRLHPRNRHRERYDFGQLIVACPDLAKFVKMNLYNDESIDFSDPEAVKMLNKALLKHFYQIEHWDIPQNYLCPPVPGRADYIHYAADLLRGKNYGKIPTGNEIKILDIGVGANCIYPLIGNKEYGWSFIGSDIDQSAIESADKIINSNSVLAGKIDLRLQPDPKDIFYGILQKNEPIDLSLCNPPFHASLAEAQSGTLRKLNNLNEGLITSPVLNFGGQNNELWCEGGEERFTQDMIRQSRQFLDSVFWFTTLISKQSTLKSAYDTLRRADAVEVETIPMGQGNKTSRLLAWTFLNPSEQKKWANTRWKMKSGK